MLFQKKRFDIPRGFHSGGIAGWLHSKLEYGFDNVGDRPATLTGSDSWRVWLFGFLLVGYLIAVILVAGLKQASPSDTLTLLDLQRPERLERWVRLQGRQAAWQAAQYAILGLLTGLALLPSTRRAVDWCRDVLARTLYETSEPPAARWVSARTPLAILLSLGLAVVVQVCLLRRLPGVMAAVGACAASLVGLWIAWSWRRRSVSRWLLIPQLLLPALLPLAITLVGLYLAFEPMPRDFRTLQLSAGDRQRLFHLVTDRGLDLQGVRNLTFDEREVNLMLAWALSVTAARSAQAHIELKPQQWVLEGSLVAPSPFPARRLLNVELAGDLRLQKDRVELQLSEFQVGRLRLPGGWTAWLASSLTRLLREDPDIQRLARAVERVQIDEGSLAVDVREEFLQYEMIPLLVGRFGNSACDPAAAREYAQELLALAPQLPPGDKRFEGLVRAAFARARRRSVQGDPIAENRAAILALAVLLGHGRVESFVGAILDEPQRTTLAAVAVQVTLLERDDWSRHFWISAAVAAVANSSISQGLGQLKEELDAAAGGSGFSFKELMFDRAGEQLASTATRDAESARHVQARLGGPWTTRQLVPSPEGLPEGLTSEQVQEEYGGVGGVGYKEVLRELEKRVGTSFWSNTPSGDASS